MNYIVDHLSAVMEYCLGTTGPETMCCTANIFVGLLESPLLIKPYLPQFTESELVTVMVSGFASLAGSVMGAYVEMNISAVDLLTTSMMSAPGSMAVAKIIQPETEDSQFKNGATSTITQSHHANMFHALVYGANDALKLCVNIVSMISAFLIMIDLTDSLFGHATGTQCIFVIFLEKVIIAVVIAFFHVEPREWVQVYVASVLQFPHLVVYFTRKN